MTPERRRAIVWDSIERLAFRPDKRGHEKWLSIFERSLDILWQVQPGDVRIKRQTGFAVDFLHLECEYRVETNEKYGVKISNHEDSKAGSSWYMHVQPRYLSKAALHRAPDSYPTQEQSKNLSQDVESVLDGMIFHPRNHVHGDDLGIHSDCRPGALRVREIRIGGGIENAYVFLAHLRFQFCILSPEAREGERKRLIQLFTAAIYNNKQQVPPGELFPFR